MEKKLYLSETNKKAGGVCGGIAEYFGVDATLIRVLYIMVTLVFVFVPGVIAYFAMWAIMPKRSSSM